MSIDQQTGEVFDDEPEGRELALVPIDAHQIDEDEIAQRLPSPMQITGAMLIARERLGNAPEAIERLAGELAKTKRDLTVATALAFARYRDEGWSVGDARALATSDEKVQAATVARDDAELKLMYARELRKTLSEDIELLRSLNANARAEMNR